MANKVTLSAVVALLGIAAFCVPAAIAQEEQKPVVEEKAKGPELDEGAQKIWDAWKKKEYHLARDGLTKASFKFAMKGGGPMGGMNVDGSYVWDGKKGTVKWDDPNMGAMMSQGGRDPGEMYAEWFAADKAEKDLAGVKITSSQDGEHTLLKAEGKSESGISEMRFDKEGVLRKMLIKQNSPQMGGEMTIKFDVEYEEHEGKLLKTGYAGTVASAMGEMKLSVSIAYETKGKYRVPVKHVNTINFGGQEMTRTTDFSDWKFDDEVK